MIQMKVAVDDVKANLDRDKIDTLPPTEGQQLCQSRARTYHILIIPKINY